MRLSKTELETRVGETRYRQLADALPHIVWTAMADGWTDYFNRRWTQLTGYELDRSYGWNWLESIHPDDRQLCTDRWRAAIERGTLFEVECRIRSIDGGYCWHLHRAVPMRDDANAIVNWQGSSIDIDDKKRSEIELDLVRQDLEAAVAERTAELVSLNRGLRLEINQRLQIEAERRVLFEIIQGVTTTSNLKEFLDLIHLSIGKVVNAENCFVALRDQTSGLMQMEFFVDRFDEKPPPQKLGRGRSAYVLRTAQPILMTAEVANRLTEAGEIESVGTPPASWMGIPLGTGTETIGVLVVQHYDDPSAFSERDLALMTSVGSQIAFAIERKQVEEQLSESEAKYRTILDTLDDGYFEVDLRGNYLFLNDAFCRTAGYQTNEVVGHNYREFCAEPLASRVFAAYREVYETGKTLKAFEYELTTRTGEQMFVEESVSLKRNAEGKPVGFMGIRRDCSERKRAERELEVARIAALESVRLKSEFLANMSHEIRTPMNGVIGMTGLLLNSPLTPMQRDFAETIRDSGESLLTIINDILDFSKIEAGKLKFEKLDFDLGTLVESTVDAFAELAREKHLELASLVHSGVPLALMGDPGRLRQVLTNLIGNALKFTEAGEVVVRVEKERETPKHVVLRFTVVDTGIGIPESARRHLFQAFTQADGTTTRKYGGTGLGLAISKQLVALMDGRIGVNSRAGDGSKFWFTARFDKQSAASTTTALPAAQLTGTRILIVDDNATNRTILGHQLSSRGIEYVEAASGPQALEILRRDTAFDLAILDLMMPEMDGFRLARRIKQDPRFAAMKLLLLTSFAAADAEPSENRDDIAAYLTKPVRQSQLFECLTELIATEAAADGSARSVAGESFVAAASLPATLPPGKRILLAEDNLVNQKVATMQLLKLGIKADTVRNGREAIDAIVRQSYDLILMDCHMPEMDGYEATAAIRRHEGDSRHTPVVAMTANALDGDRDKCLAAGMDDYVSKPVNLVELGKTLERFLSQ